MSQTARQSEAKTTSVRDAPQWIKFGAVGLEMIILFVIGWQFWSFWGLNQHITALERQIQSLSQVSATKIHWLNRCFGEVKKGESPTKHLAKLYPFS